MEMCSRNLNFKWRVNVRIFSADLTAAVAALANLRLRGGIPLGRGAGGDISKAGEDLSPQGKATAIYEAMMGHLHFYTTHKFT